MEEMTIASTEENVQCRTWGELEELPTIDSARKLYEKAKRLCRLTEWGFSVFEWGLNYVVDTLRIKRLAGSNIDVFAGKKIAQLKDSYPLLQERPSKIFRKTRQRSLRYVKRKAHWVFDNFVGKPLTFGIDKTLWVSENIMNLLWPKKRTTSEKQVQTSPISVDLNRDKMLDQKKTERVWEDNKIIDEKQSKTDMFRKVMLVPLSIFIYILQKTRKFINGSEDNKTARSATRKSTRNVSSKTITPEKLEEIQGRRKLSPRKRLPPSSLLRNLKNAAFRLFGLPTSHIKQTDIRDFLTSSRRKSLNEYSMLNSDKKKRKHPGLSEDSEEDLITMDLDGYLSAEDPDFEVTDEESTDDTIETEEDVSEGDMRVEFTEDGLFEMLKDKSDTNEVADEKQDDSSSKKTDSSVLKPSFEIGDTKISLATEKTDPDTKISLATEKTDPDTKISLATEKTDPDTKISKATEKTDPVPQTKPVEKTSIPIPTQKVSEAPVASKPTEESTGPSQPNRPPSASNPSVKSPRANKNKQGKAGGGPKTTSPPK